MKTIKKYFSLFKSLFAASAIADLEFRLNITIRILTDIIWYASQLVVFEVLFTHTDQISGWTIDTVRVFMGLLFLVDALYMLFLSENLDRFSDKVRKGDLDLLLTKPVNAQFMMSIQRMTTAYIGNFILACIWLGWALSQLPNGFDLLRLPVLLILIPCGLLITYALRFFFSVAALIFTRAENIGYVWFQIYRLGTRPDAVYPPWLRYAVLTILPVGFIASVPARSILNQPDWVLVVASVGIAAFALFLTRLYWKFALRLYSSASS